MQAAMASSPRSDVLVSTTSCLSSRPALRPLLARPPRRISKGQTGSRMVPSASSGSGEDIDSILTNLADKFEKSDNKGAIIGYGAGGLIAFFFAEWLIHLPLLNFLLGFPIQLLGLLSLPYFGVRYLVEEKSFKEDAKIAASTVTKQLPGFDK